MIISLYNESKTTIDAQETFRQIKLGDSWRLARLGARDLFYSEDGSYIQFDVKITSKKLRVVIRLSADDAYVVEIGQMKRNLDYVILVQERSIYADQLGETVERLCVEQSR